LDIIKNSTKGSKIILINCNWQDLKNVVFKDGKFEMELLKKKKNNGAFLHESFLTIKTSHYLEIYYKEGGKCLYGFPLSLEIMGSWLYGNDFFEVC